MKLPLILTEHGVVQFYQSKADLLLHIESPDIEDIVVFDAAGDVLRFGVEGGDLAQTSGKDRWYSRWFKFVPVHPVCILESEVPINRAAELEALLKEFIVEHDMAERLRGQESLADLIVLLENEFFSKQ